MEHPGVECGADDRAACEATRASRRPRVLAVGASLPLPAACVALDWRAYEGSHSAEPARESKGPHTIQALVGRSSGAKHQLAHVCRCLVPGSVAARSPKCLLPCRFLACLRFLCKKVGHEVCRIEAQRVETPGRPERDRFRNAQQFWTQGRAGPGSTQTSCLSK